MTFFLRTTLVCRGAEALLQQTAAAHFSCFAKKSKQKKGWSTAPTKLVRSPAGRGSRRRQAQIGRKNKLAALRQIFPLYPMCTCRHRLLASGLRDWLAFDIARLHLPLQSIGPSSSRTLGPSAVTPLANASLLHRAHEQSIHSQRYKASCCRCARRIACGG